MMNKYTAYSYLYEEPADLRCDFEIASDEISSMIGLLRSLVADEALREDLSRLNEIMYHINPSLRTQTAVTAKEFAWLDEKTRELQEEIRKIFDSMARSRGTMPHFVLPQGCTAACYSHIIRNKCKALVRLLYRHIASGNEVDDLILDFINLFSGYFYSLALKLNKDAGVKETEFISRVY
jgi:ATP:cob(I)alamin adenosyltransferase